MDLGFSLSGEILKRKMSAYVFLYGFADRDDRIRVICGSILADVGR